jgi:putative FmdB family regulatory protein
MAIYQYRCAQNGDFEVSRPIGMAAPQVRCAACGADAVRVFTLRCSRSRPEQSSPRSTGRREPRDQPAVLFLAAAGAGSQAADDGTC